MNPDTSEAAAALTGWLSGGCTRRSGLRIGHGQDGERGAFAAMQLAPGEVLIEVPHPYIITRELAMDAEIGRAIAASGVELGSMQAYLAAFLLQERNDEGSFFRPYLDALPTSYRNMPVLFDQHELSLLQGSFTRPWIEERKAALAAEHEGLCRHVRGFERFSLSDFLWARLAVATRAFSLLVDGHKTEALVPLADMLNYKRSRETRWAYDEKARSFVLTALRAFSAGDPVHDTYGRKSNGRLFVNYGFAVDDSDGDEAVVVLSVPSGDPLRAEKLSALGRGDGPARFQVPTDFQHESVRAMLSFLRVACATGEELGQMAGEGPEATAKPVSLRNEHAVLAALAAGCEAALAGFDTTLEEDQALLADPRLGRNARGCVLVRRGEKRVLRHHLSLARAAAELLYLPAKERARAAQAQPLWASGLAAYLDATARLAT